ncbi:MAG: hypothetical protein GWP91_20585 [Rhodobacterales bacterium]|nr:hypothetical protein [Rhodobacterales bacterium]
MHIALALVFALGCGESTVQNPVETSNTTTATTPATGCLLENVTGEVVTLNTSDGVALEADRYTGIAGKPGIVLTHMIPPSNTRADWPVNFIEKLTCHGWSVIAFDRRGTVNSGGTPVDSYEGPGGQLDIAAAVASLNEVGVEGLALIGASNGTTSSIDYAIWADANGGPEILALGLMTGGGYTENQHAMSTLPNIPVAFTYSTAEANWSVDQQPLDPGSWSFLEYEGGAHGTQMFDAKPKVKSDLEDFLLDVLPQ